MCKAIILMVGIPGSGKSTLAKVLCNPEVDTIVSRDEIRFSVLGQIDSYFSKEKLVFKKFIAEINHAAAATERYVYVDATHISPASRRKVIDKIEDETIPIYADVLNTDLNTCLLRNDLRTGRAKVPESAIRNMYNSFLPPYKGEGIKMITYWTSDKEGHWKEERKDVYGN